MSSFRSAILLLVVTAAACNRDERAAPVAAQFLLVAGDSTFWVRSGGVGGCHHRSACVRGSSIQLARFGGHFYELYVADDDHSYADATIVGQRVYRRDLTTGDSALVFGDSLMSAYARGYAREHPLDHPLGPSEEPQDDPRVTAMSEVTMLDQHGPLVNLDYRSDGSAPDGDEWHIARRSVVDLRRGRLATVADIFGDSAADRILRQGQRQYRRAIDSVLASSDPRARDAAAAVGDLRFDGTSFGVVDDARSPAVAFTAVGHGDRAGGITMALPPIPAPAPGWWSEVREQLPHSSPDSIGDRWLHGRVQVVARYDGEGERARLLLADSGGREWAVARVPGPARRIYWLDSPPLDSASIRALVRAFDDAALYNDETRSVSRRPGPGERGRRPPHRLARARAARSGYRLVAQ
ncbi:MAG: hypothetical protein ACR2OG_07830 [Gemmatimonadaceae bacterium]